MSNTFTEKKSIFEAGLEEGIWVKVFNRQEEPCIGFFKALDSDIVYTDYTNASDPVSFVCSEVTAEPLERGPYISFVCTAADITDGEAREVPDQIGFSADLMLMVDFV